MKVCSDKGNDTKEEMDEGECVECGALVTWPKYYYRHSTSEDKYNQDYWSCPNNCYDTLCSRCHPNPRAMCKKCTKGWLKAANSKEPGKWDVCGMCIECGRDFCAVPDDVCSFCKMPVCSEHMDKEDRRTCLGCLPTAKLCDKCLEWYPKEKGHVCA